jgi:hypothetical protein
MPEFLDYKNHRVKPPRWLNWEDNGCTVSFDHPLGFNFLDSCKRHDFGYNNYSDLGMLHGAHRRKIDDNFRQDLHTMCNSVNHRHTCLKIADGYFTGVRVGGGIVARFRRIVLNSGV